MDPFPVLRSAEVLATARTGLDLTLSPAAAAFLAACALGPDAVDGARALAGAGPVGRAYGALLLRLLGEADAMAALVDDPAPLTVGYGCLEPRTTLGAWARTESRWPPWPPDRYAAQAAPSPDVGPAARAVAAAVRDLRAVERPSVEAFATVLGVPFVEAEPAHERPVMREFEAMAAPPLARVHYRRPEPDAAPPHILGVEVDPREGVREPEMVALLGRCEPSYAMPHALPEGVDVMAHPATPLWTSYTHTSRRLTGVTLHWPTGG